MFSHISQWDTIDKWDNYLGNGIADNRSKMREGSSTMVRNLPLSYQHPLGRRRDSSKGRDAKDGLILFLDE